MICWRAEYDAQCVGISLIKKSAAHSAGDDKFHTRRFTQGTRPDVWNLLPGMRSIYGLFF